MSRWKTFALLLILFFVIDLVLTSSATWAFVNATAPGRPFADRYGPSFALAVTTLPLYPILLGSNIRLIGVAALNSIVVSLILSILVVTLRWRAVVVILMVFILLMGGIIAAGLILERRAEQKLGPPTAAKEDASARRIAQFAAAFGVEDEALNDVRASISSYLAGEIARGDDRIAPPPQEVEHYLVVHRWDLDELEHHLLQNAPPRFVSRRGAVPNISMLEKIVLIDALQSARGGDQDGAWQRVDAAQRLTQALLETHAVWLAISTTESQLGVARKLAPPAQFPIRRFDPHEEYVKALADDGREALHERPPWLAVPYVRLAAAERAGSLLREAQIVRRMRGCRFAPAARSEVRERVPFNPFGVFGGGARLAVLCNRMLLDFEGTEKVLALKRGMPAGGSACRDRQWKVEGNVLRLEPPLPATAPALPAHHEISPATRTPS